MLLLSSTTMYNHGTDSNRWEPRHSLGGHFGAVVDLSWSFDGKILHTVSSDQTARILTQAADGQWLEIARPQVSKLITILHLSCGEVL